MKNKNLTVRLDQQLYQKVKEESKSEGISLGEYVRNAIARKSNTNAQTEQNQEETHQIQWLKNEIEEKNKQLEASAIARRGDQTIILELQAEKKAFYDEIQQQKNLLSKPRIRLPRFLAFLSN